jgi:HEAT repeat protein
LSVEDIRRLIRSGASADVARAGRAIENLQDRKLRRELLLEMSTCPQDEFRYQCLVYLEGYGDPECIARLQLALTSDRHPGIRQGAATALGKLGGDGTVELLFRVSQDAELWLRVPVAAALNKLGHPGPAAELIPVFTPGLDSPDGAARENAVRNLANLKCVLAMPALVQATQDQSGDVRESAARGLGDLGNADAIPVLERLLKDPVPDVVEAATSSLKQLRPK